MIYTHVLTRRDIHVVSPLDRLQPKPSADVKLADDIPVADDAKVAEARVVDDANVANDASVADTRSAGEPPETVVPSVSQPQAVPSDAAATRESPIVESVMLSAGASPSDSAAPLAEVGNVVGTIAVSPPHYWQRLQRRLSEWVHGSFGRVSPRLAVAAAAYRATD